MHKKNQKRKMYIFLLGLLIAIMVVRMLTGNESTESVVIVAGEIDTSKYLHEQYGSFQTIQMKKNESQKLGASVVRNTAQLKGKRLPVKLEVGTPVPLSLLTEGKSVGNFAQQTRQYMTLYKLSGGVQLLPPGVVAGDLIDIGLLYQDDERKVKTISLIMKDVQIESVTETGDIYVHVSQSDFQFLTISADMGQFVLQLPGKKQVKNCESLTAKERKDTECYNEADKPTELTTEEVLEKIKEGIVSTDEFFSDEYNEDIKNQADEIMKEESKPSAIEEAVTEEVQIEKENQEEIEDREDRDSLIQGSSN